MNPVAMMSPIEMVNWKPSSSVRSRRPPAVPEKDPLTTMAGGNEVMYHAG